MAGSRASRRRAVVRLALICLALASAGLRDGGALPEPLRPPPLLVTVGDVRDTSAVLWIRAPAPAAIRVDVSADGAADTRSLVIEPSPARDLTGRHRLESLSAATRYRYRVRSAAHEVAGEFRTAPPAGRPAPFTLVWSADLGARGFCPRVGVGYRVFAELAALRPDVFLFLGDTIYADHRCQGEDVVPGADFVAHTLAEFQAKHRYNREDPWVQAFLARTPVWATWDDHDVRNNFAGPAEQLMPVGRQAFLDYWPIDTSPDAPAQLHRRVRYGTLAEMFVLDTRQYRSRNCRPDGPGKTMLGAAQRRWLVEGLAASTAVWKLVASSVPLSIPKGWPCGDSWAPRNLLVMSTGFAHERDEILGALQHRGVTNVVFLAGDLHFASLLRHEPRPGYILHEFVAGPLAARPQRARPPARGLGSRVLFSAGGMPTFGAIAAAPGSLTVRIFDGEGRVLATERVAPVDGARDAAHPAPSPSAGR
jgi:alkaline phosphatase D